MGCDGASVAAAVGELVPSGNESSLLRERATKKSRVIPATSSTSTAMAIEEELCGPSASDGAADEDDVDASAASGDALTSCDPSSIEPQNRHLMAAS